MPWPDYLNGDYINGVQMEGDPCYQTIADYAYRPTLLVPTQIRQLDPAWATCAVALEGLVRTSMGITDKSLLLIHGTQYDPPKALTPVAAAATPTVSTVATSTSASPASAQVTTLPTQTADPGVSKATGDPSTATSNVGDGVKASSTGDSGGSSAGLGAAGSILSQALSTSTKNVGAGVGGVVASVIGATSLAANADPSDPGNNAGAGSDPGINSGETATTVNIGGSSFTIIATTKASGSSAIIVAGGGTTATLSPGQASSIAGVYVSADPSGGVVIGTGTAATTANVVAEQSAGSDAAGVQSTGGTNNGAILTIGSNTLTAMATSVTCSGWQSDHCCSHRWRHLNTKWCRGNHQWPGRVSCV